jgi:hypothetical protein
MKASSFVEEIQFKQQWKQKIPKHLIKDEEFLRPKYEPTHPLELETKKFIKDKELVKEGYIYMMIDEEELKDIRQDETIYVVQYRFFDICAVRMNKIVFETIKASFKRYVELSEDELSNGIKHQGEIRGYYKDYVTEMDDNGEIQKVKKKLPMVQKKLNDAVSFMKKLAILVIEKEFDLRFKNFKNCRDVESESWFYQLEEAREYKNNPEAKTTFIDILAINRGISKEILVNKVLEKHHKYLVEYASLLGKYHAIRSQFKNCDNMWDMNILYEDYLNVGMPAKQAEKLGRADENGYRFNGELAYGTFGF